MEKIRKRATAIGVFLLCFMLVFLMSGCGRKNVRDMVGETAVIDRSHVGVDRLMTEEAFCLTIRQYIYARLLTEQAARIDPAKMTVEEGARLLQEAADAWLATAEMTETTQQMIDALENDGKARETALLPSPFSKAHAAGKITAKEGTSEWAKQVQDTYDSFPAKEKLSKLTKELNAADMRETHDKLVTAGKILNKDSDWNTAKETAKGLGKGALVVGGIAVVLAVPVGVYGAACVMNAGVSTGTAIGALAGTAAFGVGLVATASGAISAVRHTSEELGAPPLKGEAARHMDMVDNVALVSGTANMLISGGTAIGGALNSASKAKEAVTAGKVVKDTATAYFGSNAPQIAYTSYDTYSNVTGWMNKDIAYETKPTETGEIGVTPVELPKEEPSVITTPIEKASDEDLNAATEEYGSPEVSQQRVERVNSLKKQQETTSPDDWIYWNSNGITKAEYQRIMRNSSNDVRDHVRERLKDYLDSDAYQEELEKRKNAQKAETEEEAEEEEKEEEPVEESPYAVEKVVGTYTKHVESDGISVTGVYTITSAGPGNLKVSVSVISSVVNLSQSRVLSYDEETGVLGGGYGMRFISDGQTVVFFDGMHNAYR